MYQPGQSYPVKDIFDKRRMFRKRKWQSVVEDPNGGGAVIVKTYDRTGKQMSKTDRLMKMLAAGITRRVDRFSKLTDMTSVSNAYALSAYRNTTSGVLKLPFYIMDLCCINQTSSGYLGAVYPCPFMRLTKSNTGSSGTSDYYWWDPVAGLNPSDGTSTAFGWLTIEGKTSLAANTAAIKRAMIGTIDIDMVFTGATKYTSEVTVQLIQFDEDLYCPSLMTVTDFNGTGLTTQETKGPDMDPSDEALYEQFWTNQVDHLIGHPFNEKDHRKVPRPYNVLYSKKLKINPASTLETNTDGHDMVFRLKYDMNKIISYDVLPWSGNPDQEDTLENVNRAEVIETVEQLYPTCQKKGRVYLVIKGTCPKLFSGAGQGELTSTDLTENYATFDLKVTRDLYKLRAENMG